MMDFKTIGQSRPLIDGPAKVTGVTRFTADLNTPGLLHARFVASLHAHANIRAIDVSGAMGTPGVVAVLTAEDMPEIAPSSRTRLLLARDRVIFAGQPVAMVLATSAAAAEDGAGQVMVDYEPLPAASTLDEALAENAPLVWPAGVPSGAGSGGAHGAESGGGQKSEQKRDNIASQKSYKRGDVAAGFAQADVILERTFTTPIVHQSAVEPHSIMAESNPITGGMTVWASTQDQFGVRREVARVLGLPESDVRVIGMAVGGGFGGKNGLYEPLVAAAARAAGRPVRLTLTRMEEMVAANPAPYVRLQLRLGAKRDGTLTALSAEVHADNGCYPFELAGFLVSMAGSFYRVPNFELRGTDVLTFKASAGAYRAPGAPSVIFALDSMMDELAQKLSLDPIELRLQNAARSGDLMADDDPWPGIGMVAVLEALRQHPAWQTRDQARAQGRGAGVAVGGWPGGTEPAAAACKLNRDGLIQIHVGSIDLNGTATGFTLLAAEAFGVPPEKVRVVVSDTDTAPYSGASAGSKVTYATGAAVVAAAQEARRQVLAIAADELEAAVEDLEIVDGAVQVRGVPGRAIKLSDIARKTMQFSGKYPPVFGQGRVAQTESAPAFSAQLAEVEVDRETGEVRLHKLVVVQDVGRAVNPLAIRGQMMGGATQGIGWALYEQMIYDANGQLLTGSWMDYAVPNIIQTPPAVETIIVEVPSETGPYGARGVGEAPVVPTAAAIANAIADATGARLTDLPMTAPRVLAALKLNDL
jgi:CO/xanthine dehydrogenase Mo-binding subunit